MPLIAASLCTVFCPRACGSCCICNSCRQRVRIFVSFCTFYLVSCIYAAPNTHTHTHGAIYCAYLKLPLAASYVHANVAHKRCATAAEGCRCRIKEQRRRQRMWQGNSPNQILPVRTLPGRIYLICSLWGAHTKRFRGERDPHNLTTADSCFVSPTALSLQRLRRRCSTTSSVRLHHHLLHYRCHSAASAPSLSSFLPISLVCLGVARAMSSVLQAAAA